MACDEPLYSIREVSELTGIKPVTLRAWQRRYSLVQPQRTEKGHRLYLSSDIATIRKIQGWLAKGVSIGKVKPLLLGQPSDIELDKPNELAEYLWKSDIISIEQDNTGYALVVKNSWLS